VDGVAGAVAFDPANPDIRYVATGFNTYNQSGSLYKSVDGGTSWRKLPDAPGGVLLPGDGTTNAIAVFSVGRIYRSMTGGE
jgi:hypothetical protein